EAVHERRRAELGEADVVARAEAVAEDAGDLPGAHGISAAGEHDGRAAIHALRRIRADGDRGLAFPRRAALAFGARFIAIAAVLRIRRRIDALPIARGELRGTLRRASIGYANLGRFAYDAASAAIVRIGDRRNAHALAKRLAVAARSA